MEQSDNYCMDCSCEDKQCHCNNSDSPCKCDNCECSSCNCKEPYPLPTSW